MCLFLHDVYRYLHDGMVDNTNANVIVNHQKQFQEVETFTQMYH